MIIICLTFETWIAKLIEKFHLNGDNIYYMINCSGNNIPTIAYMQNWNSNIIFDTSIRDNVRCGSH